MELQGLCGSSLYFKGSRKSKNARGMPKPIEAQSVNYALSQYVLYFTHSASYALNQCVLYALNQLCTQSVSALCTQPVMHSVSMCFTHSTSYALSHYALSQYVLYALSQLCTQSVCALRIQLCTQSVCALRTQTTYALRTQSACALRTGSRKFKNARGIPKPIECFKHINQSRMGINALCIQSGAFSQLCTQSVCALLYALSQYVIYALNQLCTQSSACALRTQSACALRTQSACALRTQSACALRTQYCAYIGSVSVISLSHKDLPFSVSCFAGVSVSIQDKPSSYAAAAGGPLPEPSAVVVETDVLKESLTMGVPLIEGTGFTIETVTIEYEPKATVNVPNKGATNLGNASKSSSMLKNQARKAIVPPTKERNITMSNSYAALDDESEEDVENVYDESANLLNSTKTGESSSTFTVVVS
ncbi:hypothetical protein Tco_0809461 [Tanacetum coccineum]